MSRIEQLPEVTEQVLSGLQAGDELKSRIYKKALEPDSRFCAGPDDCTLLSFRGDDCIGGRSRTGSFPE